MDGSGCTLLSFVKNKRIFITIPNASQSHVSIAQSKRTTKTNTYFATITTGQKQINQPLKRIVKPMLNQINNLVTFP
jgi:hypothetical protein